MEVGLEMDLSSYDPEMGEADVEVRSSAELALIPTFLDEAGEFPNPDSAPARSLSRSERAQVLVRGINVAGLQCEYWGLRMGVWLKEIRDSGLYLELGTETWEGFFKLGLVGY